MKAKDKTKRSIVKAITFRTTILVADFVIISALTHRYDLALGVMFFSNISSTFFYFLHERIWNRVQWGRA